MNEDSLDVTLNLITSGANKALDGLEKSFKTAFNGVNNSISTANSAFTSVSKSIFSVQTAAIAAGTAILTYFASNEVIDKAIEEEEAINSVGLALARTGEYSKQAMADMQAFASELEQTTVYSGGEILNQVNLAKAYGATAEQAKIITKASIELAAATGKSLEEASRQVTTTLSGQAGALGKLSPRIKQLTEDQLRAGEAARILLEQYSGTAIGKINTFGGALQQSENVFDGLLTNIGMLITKNPVVVAGIKAVTEVFQNLAELLERNRDAIIAFVNEGLVTVLESAPKIGEFFKFMVSALTIMTKSLSLASAGVGVIVQALLQFGPIKTLFDGLVATITLVTSGILDLLSVLAQLPGVSDTLEAMGFNVEELSQSLHNAANESKDLFNTFNADAITESVEKANEFAFSIADGADEVKNNLNKSIDEGVKKATELAKTVKGIASQGQVELKVVNNQESMKESIDNFQQLLEVTFGGATGGKIANTFITSIANGLKNGKEGARAMISSVSGAVADAFLPGLGAAVGPVVDMLSQGPEAVQKMVRDFTNAIPDLIQNIIESVPVLIEELSDQLPIIIERLAEKADDIVIALARAMPRVAISLAAQAPKIMIAIAKEAPRFVWALVEEIAAAVQRLFDNITSPGDWINEGGNWFSNATGIKFATGGEVPSGFPNDTMPAKLSSGELVIDRSTNSKLKDFLGGKGGGGNTDALLVRVIQLLEQPMVVQTQATMNQKPFADILLQLSRTKQRTS